MSQRQVQILIGLAVVVAVLLVVLIVVMVIGWGDPEAAPTSLPTTTVASTSTTSEASTTSTPTTTSSTTSSTTTSTSTTTTTTLPAGVCAGAGAGPMVMGGSFSVLLTSGDFDGDAAEDRFLLYEDLAGEIRARVELSYGYAVEAADPVRGVGLTNALALNFGGPTDLALAVTVGHASEGEATFLRLHECELEVVERSDGTEAYFVLGANWVGWAGVTCRADGITVTSARPEGGGDWQVSSVTYRWDPAAGVLEGTLGAIAVLHSPEDDAAIESHGDFNC